MDSASKTGKCIIVLFHPYHVPRLIHTLSGLTLRFRAEFIEIHCFCRSLNCQRLFCAGPVLALCCIYSEKIYNCMRCGEKWCVEINGQQRGFVRVRVIGSELIEVWTLLTRAHAVSVRECGLLLSVMKRRLISVVDIVLMLIMNVCAVRRHAVRQKH